MSERVNSPAGDPNTADRERADWNPDALDADQKGLIDGPPTVLHQGDSVTTGSLPVLIDEQNLPMPRPIRQPLWKWLTLFTAGVTVVGCLAGMLWFLVVPLATYQIQADGQARVTERGLANFVAADAWFMIFGLVLGITVGIVVWSWFSGLGWQCVPLAIVASTVMGLLCWGVGTLLGPGPISGRLATAAPGDIVPIEFTLRATVGLVVWPFGAVLVLMLISALVPDPEDPGLEGRHATH